MTVLPLLYGCATVKMANVGQEGYAEADDERRLKKRTDEACEFLDDSGFIYQNPQLEQYLNRVAAQLIPREVQATPVRIQVKVLSDPTLNAFAFPNGRIYIHTGMLAAIENEAQLATLLGHEMVHVINRHALKQFRSIINQSALLSTVAITTGGLPGILAQVAVISSVYGYAQSLESEADEVGFQLVKDAKYDLEQTPKLFEHLKVFIEEEKIKVPFFFSTHPGVKARIHGFNKMLEREPPRIEEGRKDIADYRSMTQKLLLDNARLCFHLGMFKTAERNINRYVTQYPGEPQGYFYLGELHRQRQDPVKKEKRREKAEDYIKAVEAYEKAIALDADFAPAWEGMGMVLRKQNKTVEAKESFQRYLKLNPDAKDREYIEHFLSSESSS